MRVEYLGRSCSPCRFTGTVPAVTGSSYLDLVVYSPAKDALSEAINSVSQAVIVLLQDAESPALDTGWAVQ